MRRFATAIPVGIEPIAHELLVEARLLGALDVSVDRPEARRIRREHFVAQDDRAIHLAEFKFRIGDDDAALACMLGSTVVDRKREILNSIGIFKTDELSRLIKADVLVVIADLCLRGRCEDRFGQARRIHQPCRKLDAANCTRLLVVLYARA